MNNQHIVTNTAPVVTFVSTGPGDAEFLTQASSEALQTARKIYCFGRQKGSTCTSRTLDTLRGLDATMAERAVVIALPMSAERQAAQEAYDQLTQHLCADHAGQCPVAVCVEGSANIYASVRYVMQHLDDLGIPYAETAGIPSFVAAATIAHLSLCEQQERLMVIPGTITADEIETFLNSNTNLVVMKLSHCSDDIHKCLHRHPDYQYHYFENVGTPEQFYSNDINRIAAVKQYPYFSLLVIKPSLRQTESPEQGHLQTK